MESVKVFSFEEAIASSLQYFSEDDLAAKVFVDKYALRNDKQQLIESNPDDMHWRLANEFARVEAKKFKQPLTAQQVYDYFKHFKRIVPQGSPMYGIGNRFQIISLSNCYVVDPPADSYGGIHLTDEQLTQISKRRGGVGLDISALRPSGASTKNAARTSTGIIPFMERFSNSIREVGQAGRRGALMITISVHHPQVMDFVTVKRDLKRVTGANISIRLTDEFLNAVQHNEEYEQRWPVDSKTPTISRKVNAKEVWMKIIENAHAMAEPGLLFWDNILRESPADCYKHLGFGTVSTNPCSEIPLPPMDSCRLLLLNAFGYVSDPFTKNAKFDYLAFYEEAKVAQRLMDDLIDLEVECIDRILMKISSDPESFHLKRTEFDMWTRIRKVCEEGRRTGTGITAIGDCMAALGIRYGSDESIEFTDKIYKTLKLGCYRSSVDMAKEIGSFKGYDPEAEKNNPFIQRIADEDPELYADMCKYGRRNIALLTTAPAGTVSIQTQTTSGIEPLFMIGYKRRKKVNPSDTNVRVDFVDPNGDSYQEFMVYHAKVKDWMSATGETDVTKSPWYGCCAEDLDWAQRVKLQATAQKHVDHAISSTINLPEDVSVEKVAEIYETAWRAGCKGITVYRKNCRSGVLVEDKKQEPKLDKIKKNNAPKRPEKLPCDVHQVRVRGQDYFVLVGLHYGDPYEVFAGKNNGVVNKKVKSGITRKIKRGVYECLLDDGSKIEDCTAYSDHNEDARTRYLSTALRHGADIAFVVQQCEKVKAMEDENVVNSSFDRAIARALKKYIPNGSKVTGDICAACKSDALVRQEGCIICKNCGSGKCG